MDYAKTDLMAKKERMDEIVELLEESNDNLQHSLEVTTKERDEARSHNVVLRQALECISKNDSRGYNILDINGFEHYEVKYGKYGNIAKQALSSTPSDSAAKVQKLVDALEDARKFLPNATSLPRKIVTEIGTTVKMVDGALAEWMGEK